MVKAFEDALTLHAKRRLERDPDMTLLIERCIATGWLPEALAEHVGHGIYSQQPMNGRELMLYRLRRASGEPERPAITGDSCDNSDSADAEVSHYLASANHPDISGGLS